MFNTGKKKLAAIFAAAGVSATGVLGYGAVSTPEPVPVKASLCEKGKLAVPVKFEGKAYKVGAPCKVIVPAKKSPKR